MARIVPVGMHPAALDTRINCARSGGTQEWLPESSTGQGGGERLLGRPFARRPFERENLVEKIFGAWARSFLGLRKPVRDLLIASATRPGRQRVLSAKGAWAQHA